MCNTLPPEQASEAWLADLASMSRHQAHSSWPRKIPREKSPAQTEDRADSGARRRAARDTEQRKDKKAGPGFSSDRLLGALPGCKDKAQGGRDFRKAISHSALGTA